MENVKFKTSKSVAMISKYHEPLSKNELKAFDKEVENVLQTLSNHEGRELGLEPAAFNSITEYMKTVASYKKKKFKTFSGIIYCFGLLIAKAIISKYGGVLVKDRINGDIDVLIPHGNYGGCRMFYPHRFLLNLFEGGKEGVADYLELVDNVINMPPVSFTSDLIITKPNAIKD